MLHCKMHWHQVTGDTGYIGIGNALVPGYLLPSGGMVLIDSGPVESPRLLEMLEQYHWDVRAVIHTHLHIDHVANNRLLSGLNDVAFYASREEVEDIRSPERMMRAYRLESMEQALEMQRLYYGKVHAIDPQCQSVMIDGAEFVIIPLSGHSSGHIAVVTPDQVCCLGDAVVSESVLRVSKLPYMLNAGAALASMREIEKLDYPFYMIAHQSVENSDSINKVRIHNISKEEKIQQLAFEIVRKPMQLAEAIDYFIQALGIRYRQGWAMDVIRQTAGSRFNYLFETGKLKIEENGMIYPIY